MDRLFPQQWVVLVSLPDPDVKFASGFFFARHIVFPLRILYFEGIENLWR